MLCTLTVNQLPRLTLDVKIQRTISGKETSNIPLNPQRTHGNGSSLITVAICTHKDLKRSSRKDVNPYSPHLPVLGKQSFASKTRETQEPFACSLQQSYHGGL